jgi:hypothetical protein
MPVLGLRVLTPANGNNHLLAELLGNGGKKLF